MKFIFKLLILFNFMFNTTSSRYFIKELVNVYFGLLAISKALSLKTLSDYALLFKSLILP